MQAATQNNFYIDESWGLFVGQLNDNVAHKHFAIQISLTADGKLFITDENKTHSFLHSCFINANVTHRLSADGPAMIMLINPLSSIGHQLYLKFKSATIIDGGEIFKELSKLFHDYLNNNIPFTSLLEGSRQYLIGLQCVCEQENHIGEDRIYKAIQYLEQNYDRVVSLKEIAGYCFLSPTRFLHLFKETTKVNFRRYQLWNKLIKSLPYLNRQSITQTAHQFGFTDSSHYTRTFKETFGINPKFLLVKE